MFKLEFHLTLFLFYNNRRCSRDWRNETEEKIVKQLEEYHAAAAAKYLMLNVQQRVLPGLVKLPQIITQSVFTVPTN